MSEDPAAERALRAELEALQARVKEKTRLLERPESEDFAAAREEAAATALRLERELAELEGPLALVTREREDASAAVHTRQEQHRKAEHQALSVVVLFLVLGAGVLSCLLFSSAIASNQRWAIEALAFAVPFAASLLSSGKVLRSFGIPSLAGLRDTSSLARLATVLTLGGLGALGWYTFELVSSESFTGGRGWAVVSLALSLAGLAFTTVERARRAPDSSSTPGQLLRALGLMAPGLVTVAALVEQSIAAELTAATVVAVGFLGASGVTVVLEGVLRRRLWPWLRARAAAS